METTRALEGCLCHTNENTTEFVKVLLVKFSDMLDSSNFIRLFHCQSSALYGIYARETDHVGTTSEIQFFAPYYRYIHTLSKHSDNITRSGQVCFSTQLFLAMQITEKPVQMMRDLWWDGMYPNCLLHISFIFCCGL